MTNKTNYPIPLVIDSNTTILENMKNLSDQDMTWAKSYTIYIKSYHIYIYPNKSLKNQ